MNKLIENIVYEPWPWWIGGPLIGLFVLILLVAERKQLGISSSYNFICSKISPIKLDYFKDNSRAKWQFSFALGLIAGGALIFYLIPEYQVDVSDESLQTLGLLGITEQLGYAPKELYNSSPGSLVWLLLGGFFLGFGARYANGCTAGHAIMGVSQLAPASIIATVCFFIGGLFATYFIIPLIF